MLQLVWSGIVACIVYVCSCYCLAGLQMGYFLHQNGRNYTIFEKNAVAGQWHVLPKHLVYSYSMLVHGIQFKSHSID